MSEKYINSLEAQNGRIRKEDDSLINMADKLSPTPLEESSAMVAVDASTSVSLNVPVGAAGARLQPSQPIRFWLDGTEPTATEGFYIGAYDAVELESPAELTGLKMIAVSSAASVAVGYTRLSE